MTDTREVRLPAELCAAAEKKFGQKFGTLEEFLTFLLREVLRDGALKADEAEQRMIDERLRELGYL
jgi:hypothetical protein